MSNCVNKLIKLMIKNNGHFESKKIVLININLNMSVIKARPNELSKSCYYNCLFS